MFRLNVIFKGANIPSLCKIEWAHPINMNSPKNEISRSALPSAKFDTLVCLSLNKEE